MEEMNPSTEQFETPAMSEEEQAKINQMANEALVEMLTQIFSKEKIEEFLASLDENQNMYVAAFVTGFRSHLRYATGNDEADIVGVFSHEYIEEKKLPQEVLDLIALRSFSINVTPLNLSFDIFWQDNHVVQPDYSEESQDNVSSAE